MQMHKVDGWICAGFLAGCAAGILVAILYGHDTPGWLAVSLPFLVGPILGAAAFWLTHERRR